MHGAARPPLGVRSQLGAAPFPVPLGTAAHACATASHVVTVALPTKAPPSQELRGGCIVPEEPAPASSALSLVGPALACDRAEALCGPDALFKGGHQPESWPQSWVGAGSFRSLGQETAMINPGCVVSRASQVLMASLGTKESW